MLNFHTNHKTLVLTAFGVFLALSLIIAVIPASNMQKIQPVETIPALTPTEVKGLQVYIREGCVACHTQQVRNIEMDKTWGSRPTIAEDFYYSKKRLDVWRQSPSLLGSERTGPDLANIGQRQPSDDWHLLHLYNPRSVVETSIMPSYPWLFSEKAENEIQDDDRVINAPEKYFSRSGYKLIANEDALSLVAYLKSLKLSALPDSMEVDDFIPSSSTKKSSNSVSRDQTATAKTENIGLDGANLYSQTCAACHQANGQGIPGAFPSLAGSNIVNNSDPKKLISIILQGYSELPEYGPMPPFDYLNDAEIAAIATHERSSWGNNAEPVSEKEVKEIREFILNQNN